MSNYRLTLSKSQAETLIRALDLYTRIGLGQLEEIAHMFAFEISPDEKDRLRAHLDQAKLVLGHPANGSHGINSIEVDDDFRAAYDIQQVVRHRLAWDKKPEGGIQVNFDEPRQTSDQPLPQIYAAPRSISEAAKEARKPPPPESLVGALQDRIHAESGKLLKATPINKSKKI